MSTVASATSAIIWAVNAIAWLLTKVAWLALLALGLFIVLLMLATSMLHGELKTEYLNIGLFFGGLIPLSVANLVNPTAMKHRHTVSEPQISITVRRSWPATAGKVAGILMMALACFNALASGIEDGFEFGLALAGAILFSVTALSLIRLQLIASLTLSPEGLDYSLFRVGAIPWQDIGSVEVERVLRSDVVVLHLRDEEKYYRRGFKRLARWARLFASTPFMLPDAMFDVSPEWLRHAVEIRLAHFRTADRPQAVERQGSH